ncbi:hypothetical protein JCM8547_008153 [Rhodosporidiobolus lusitaniae]
MAHSRQRRHPPLRLSPRACSSSSDLYTYPTSTDTLPVYEDIQLTWDPTCVDLDSDAVDVYLSILDDDSGWLAVREWTGATYDSGKLETQLQPGWWNASTGAGSVSAQLSLVPSGQPSWNTPAPSGPVFTITYNGTYPSVTQSAITSAYTGPSVESVENKSSSSPSGGKLGAAIAVPLLVVAVAAVGYVLWNRKRKQPEKKRFSAVVDQRMSMISQGTWQPRPSMASRPGSFHPGHRPSGSTYSAFPHEGNRNSTYSFAGSVHNPSPLGAGVRPPPPAEMRQTGSGDRVSRISFAAGEGMPRPSMTSSRHAAKPSSIHTRSSLHQSQLRNSTFLASTEPLPSPGLSSSQRSPNLTRSTSSPPSSPGFASQQEDYFSRSGSKEELASLRSPSSSSLKPSPLGHAHKASQASSLRNELAGLPAIAVMRDGNLAYSSVPTPTSPFHDPLPSPRSGSSSSLSSSPPSRPKPTLQSLATENLASPSSSMSPAFRSSQILSPDAALASYARDAVSPPPGARRPSLSAKQSSQSGGGIARSAGMLFAKPAKMLRSLTGSSLNVAKMSKTPFPEVEKESDDPERAKSPFEDPVEEGDEHLPQPGLRAKGLGVGMRHSTAPSEASRYSQADAPAPGPGQAM